MRVISLDSGSMPASASASPTSAERVRIAGDFEFVAASLHVVGAGFQGDLHQLVFVHFVGRDDEQPLALEHPGHAAGGAELAVEHLEDLANLGGRAIAVVGEDFAHHGHAAGAVALVEHFFEIAAVELAGARLDRAVDIVVGHADGLGGVDGIAEAEIHVRIAAAHLRRDDDRLGQLAPQLAALVVDEGLLAGDVRPMGMTCHGLVRGEW